MFFLLSRKAWGPALWLAALGCRVAYRNVSLQALILGPVVLVFLLLPAVFDRRGTPGVARRPKLVDPATRVDEILKDLINPDFDASELSEQFSAGPALYLDATR